MLRTRGLPCSTASCDWWSGMMLTPRCARCPLNCCIEGAPLVDILRFRAIRGDFAPTPPDQAIAELLAAAGSELCRGDGGQLLPQERSGTRHRGHGGSARGAMSPLRSVVPAAARATAGRRPSLHESPCACCLERAGYALVPSPDSW